MTTKITDDTQIDADSITITIEKNGKVAVLKFKSISLATTQVFAHDNKFDVAFHAIAEVMVWKLSISGFQALKTHFGPRKK